MVKQHYIERIIEEPQLNTLDEDLPVQQPLIEDIQEVESVTSSSSSTESKKMKNEIFFLICTILIMFFICCCFILAILPKLTGNWSNWEQATCMPDNCFCEKPRNNLLQQPINTWSNMAFCITGIITIIMAAKSLLFKEYSILNYYAFVYGFGQIILGLMSAWYHASLTYIGQLLDNIGMVLALGWVTSYSFVRLTPKIRKGWFWIIYLTINLIYTLLNIFWIPARRYAFFVLIIITLIIQVIVDLKIKPWKEQKRVNYIYYGLALLFAAVAFIIWIIDLQGIVCYPNSFIQGHGIWHTFMSFSLLCLFMFFRSEKIRKE